MALTETQKQELDATYSREGGQTATDLANIEYAKKQGYVPPTTSTPASPTTPIYKRLPPGVSQEAYDAALADKYKTKTPEEAATEYRTSQMKAMQERINQINTIYAEKLKSELAAQAPVNENNLGRTNALSAFMGLSGSATSATRTAGQEKRNADINAGISAKVNAEKTAALEAIYGKIDEGAQKMYEAQLATNKANQKALLDDVATNALSNLQAIAGTLADTGKTFDDFKTADPEGLQSLIDQTGKSEYQLRTEWKNALPEDLRPTTHTSYRDDGKGGTIMSVVEFNPITKKATSSEYPINAPISTFQTAEKPIEGKNGELFVKQADGSYKDVSPNAENNKALAEADIAYKKAQTANQWRLAGGGNSDSSDDKSMEDKVITYFSGVVGKDNKVSPQDWQEAKRAWIDDGGNATDFDTKFKGYKNPDNPYYNAE